MTNPEKPIGLATIGGIVTINGGYKHPSFMVVDLDEKTLLPVNMYTYYMNLDEANETGTPVWRVLHGYSKEYSLLDMSPDSMRDLAIQILPTMSLPLSSKITWIARPIISSRKPTSSISTVSLIPAKTMSNMSAIVLLACLPSEHLTKLNGGTIILGETP